MYCDCGAIEVIIFDIDAYLCSTFCEISSEWRHQHHKHGRFGRLSATEIKILLAEMKILITEIQELMLK